MANGNGNGKANGHSTLRKGDAVIASALLDLCSDIRVEALKMEGLAHAILHRRAITSRDFRRQYLASIRTIGQRHLDTVARVERELGESAA